MELIKKRIADLASRGANMGGTDFLLTWEKTMPEILATLDVADILREMYKANISTRLFQSGLAVSLFRDKSTRTRYSFESASNLLGLALHDLDEGKSQISHGETVRETANMISFLTEVIGIRDDMYLGAGNAYMREVAQSVQDGFDAGVLPQRPTLVNLQCDIDHPTQAMADLAHLAHHFGGLEKLRGKKIAMTWAYSPSYGKPLSVPQGIIGLMTRFGMDVTLAHPEGYNLIPDVVEVAGKQATASGGKFQVAHSMGEAFENADIVYPKSWAPYEVMGKRTELLRAKDHKGLEDLEKVALGNNARFKNWECTEELMKKTRDGKALYMHCLPADISGVSCKEGEVAASVFDRYRNDTYVEAGFKPFVIASMMLLARFNEPVATLEGLLSRGTKRRG